MNGPTEAPHRSLLQRAAVLGVAALLAVLWASAPTAAQDASVAAVVERIMPSVVTFVVGPGGGAVGSGVVIHQDGFLVTNAHVVEDGSLLAEVQGRTYAISVVASDSTVDLALVRINRSGLPAASWGDSASLRAGDSVLIIGAPLGYQNSVQTGIVGNPSSESEVGPAILLDANINPGNSGGPVVTMSGQVMGLVFAKLADSGLGLAIPANTVLAFAAEHGVSGILASGHPLADSAPWAAGRGVEPEPAPSARVTVPGILWAAAGLLVGLAVGLLVPRWWRRRSRRSPPPLPDVNVVLHRR